MVVPRRNDYTTTEVTEKVMRLHPHATHPTGLPIRVYVQDHLHLPPVSANCLHAGRASTLADASASR